MITRALVYLPDAEAGAAARAVVGGRPVLVRLLLAAQRAGVQRVALPGVARAWGLTGDPRVRSLVVWLDELDETERASWQSRPLLLLPPTVLLDLRGLRTLLAETPGPRACAVAETKGLASPVLLAPPELVRPLWSRLAAGLPVGEDLEAATRRRATRWVPAGGLCAPVTGAAQRADAETGLYASLGIPADSLVDRLVHRRVSRALTQVLVRLGVTPNQVTLMSLLAGVAATWLLWDATPLSACLGVVAYALAVVLDHADGDVARLTFQESPLGARLDLVVDGLVQTLVMLALGVTAARVGGRPAMVAGIVAAAGAMLSAICAARFGVGPGRHAGAGGALDRLGNRDFVYLVLAVFVAGVWLAPAILPPLVMVLAVGSQAFWLGCLVRRRGGRLALAVALAAATGVGPAAASAASDTVWDVVEIDGAPVVVATGSPHLVLGAEGNRVSGLAGCTASRGASSRAPTGSASPRWRPRGWSATGRRWPGSPRCWPPWRRPAPSASWATCWSCGTRAARCGCGSPRAPRPDRQGPFWSCCSPGQPGRVIRSGRTHWSNSAAVT